MLGARRAGLMGKMPPAQIVEKSLDDLGVRRSKWQDQVMAGVAHLGFGMASGALFGVLDRRLELKSRVTGGMAFGTLVYALSYFGWVPALGFLPQPPRDRPGRPTSMFLSHLVYGATLGVLVPRLQVRSAA